MAIYFDPNDSELRLNPYKYLNKLRDEASILRSTSKGTHVVLSYDYVKKLMSDSSLSVRYIPKHVDFLANTEMPSIKSLGQSAIVFTDPPRHQRLRKLHMNVFNNKIIDGFLAGMSHDVANVLIKLDRKESIDIVKLVADQIPRKVLSNLLGIPSKYQEKVIEILLNVRGLLEPSLLTPRKLKRLEMEFSECRKIFYDIIKGYRQNPELNIISLLMEKDKKGDYLTDEELVISCALTFIAGHETTKGLISSAAKMFAENSDQWEMLKCDRSLMDNAINEITRFEPPLHFTTRLATSDFDLDGYDVGEGDLVLLCLASANRDPKEFDNPNFFDIQRESKKNVSFGLGMHNCIGSYLAQIELKLLFEQMLNKGVRFHKNDDYLAVWSSQGPTTRSLDKLYVSIS